MHSSTISTIRSFPPAPRHPTCVCFIFYLPPAPLPGVRSKHTKQKKITTTPHTTANTPCLPAPSAHASYKGYGCNNAKPPRPPHRNTMIDVVVLGCGPIWTGEGAAAPFIGVHILGEIRPAGGFDTLAESRWEDQIGPSIPVQKLNHTTRRRKLGGIFDAWGGWKALAIGDRAVHFNGSARSYSINTPQSTSVRLGGG